MKILVIDDDQTILDLVAQYLSLSAHHDVHSAISARAALEAIGQSGQPFDCFLVDIQMSGVDGISLIQLLRETAEYRNTPIIMLTAMQERQYIDRAFSAGATDYVRKPFDFTDLEQRVRTAHEEFLRQSAGEGEPPGQGGQRDAAMRPESYWSDDQIALAEVKTAIDYSEFENYVRQLQNGRLHQAPAIAVKIGSAEQVRSELSVEDYHKLTRDVALAVEETLLAKGGLFSYAGKGVFFCIPESRLKGHRKAMQKALNKHYQYRFPNPERGALTLFVGDQVALGEGSGGYVLDSLIRSLDSMEGENTASQGEFFRPRKNLMKRRRIFSLG